MSEGDNLFRDPCHTSS